MFHNKIGNVETDWRGTVLITTVVSLIVHSMPCTVHPPSINFYDDSCDGLLFVEERLSRKKITVLQYYI